MLLINVWMCASPFRLRPHFDMLIASMTFNEVPAYCLKHALQECYRVMNNTAVLLMAVLHLAFIASLQKRDLLKG